jgi:hypothetical protein
MVKALGKINNVFKMTAVRRKVMNGTLDYV